MRRWERIEDEMVRRWEGGKVNRIRNSEFGRGKDRKDKGERPGGKGAERQLVTHSSKVKGLEAGKQGSGKGELNIFD